jgi:hypothetical protein
VNGPNPGKFAREAIDDFPGSIRGSVVDNNPFRRRIRLFQDGINRSLEILFLVANRRDDHVFWSLTNHEVEC